MKFLVLSALMLSYFTPGALSASSEKILFSQLIKISGAPVEINPAHPIPVRRSSVVKKLIKQFKAEVSATPRSKKSGWAIGGFLLGFFLLPVGVLIAHLSSKNKVFRKWSWFGFGAGLIILILIGLAIGSLFAWN